MTEDEARKKWCPFARRKHAGAAGWQNSPPGLPTNGLVTFSGTRSESGDWVEEGCCIASDCMAWRWKHKQGHPYDELGYCGLAGGSND